MEACSDVTSSSDKWLSRLTVSSWLTHVKEIMNCGCLAAQCLDKEKASVVVHGSEGTDVSLCVTSIAQVILNPDCRTVRGYVGFFPVSLAVCNNNTGCFHDVFTKSVPVWKGLLKWISFRRRFEALIEREWIQAGHPFWSRCGRGPFSDSVASKSRIHAPTFTIFLDCVFQLHNQFPCSFEFTENFLVYLADSSYFSQFGTFLCDSEMERLAHFGGRKLWAAITFLVNVLSDAGLCWE